MPTISPTASPPAFSRESLMPLCLIARNGPSIADGLASGCDASIAMSAQGNGIRTWAFWAGPDLRREFHSGANGRSRDRPLDAGTGDETSDDIVHKPLASPALSAGWPAY